MDERMTGTRTPHGLGNAPMISAVDDSRPFVLSGNVQLRESAADVVSAHLFATAHGIYEASVNGRPATNSLFNPGWTAYEWRLQVQDFDVTESVRAGAGRVTIDVDVAEGWYRGDLGYGGALANYGTDVGFSAALEVVFTDGTVQRFETSSSWEARESRSTRASIYHGQTIDARVRPNGPSSPTREITFDRDTLVSDLGVDVERQEVLPPIRTWKSTAGRTLVDFGQVLVGWVRFAARGPSGATITVRHAEVLEHGELGTRPLRHAEATDVFILSGERDEFEPTLTFHGFRYVEIDGWTDEVTLEDLAAVVVQSTMRRTGYFESSHPLLDRLIENSVWGQKGNFLDIPTDCPQRDERLGWTGDIAAYAPTASFQFDTADFLDKWLLDLAEETRHAPGAIVPNTVPNVLKYVEWEKPLDSPTTVWGDAAVWVPQALWTAYGDTDRLAAHYPGMVLHLDSVERALSPTGLWDTGFQFGDWLDPDAPPEDAGAAKADPGVVATASLYRSASFAAAAANALGLTGDAARWTALAERTRAAFTEHYVDNGRIRSDCATVYALAINFELLDAAESQRAAARLSELVRASGHRVTTGFAGTPYVTWALSEHGYADDAYRLLLQTECPSWLYPVTMGATTIWERWDSMLPDGTINPGEMTSFNHYALGAVADWVYQVVGGIRPAAPGYASILIQPVPGPGLTHATTRFDSRHGTISTRWRIENGNFSLDVTVPYGIPAEIVLPNGSTSHVIGGEHHFSVIAGD